MPSGVLETHYEGVLETHYEGVLGVWRGRLPGFVLTQGVLASLGYKTGKHPAPGTR